MPEGGLPHRPDFALPSVQGKESRLTPLAASALAPALSQVLAATPSALITDIDGTISRIVARPEDAGVSAVVRRSLETLARRLALVAVVTARDQATAVRMVGAEGITYVGNYGLEGGGLETGFAGAETEARRLIQASPCVQFEAKGVSFALHYRNCDDPESVRRLLIEGLAPIAGRYGARLLEGKRVVELVPGSLPDKASAVLNLSRRHGLKGIVYFGDDLGDIPVFEALRRRREEEGLPGLAFAVVDAETDPSVSAAADGLIDGVDAVEALLAELAATERWLPLRPGSGQA